MFVGLATDPRVLVTAAVVGALVSSVWLLFCVGQIGSVEIERGKFRMTSATYQVLLSRALAERDGARAVARQLADPVEVAP